MKKCAVLFSIFLVTLTVAVITDNSDEVTMDEQILVEKDSRDHMLAAGTLNK